MTAPARITQADADRAMKSLRAGGVQRARVIHDLKNQRIEIIIGESVPESLGEQPASDQREVWSDDDL